MQIYNKGQRGFLLKNSKNKEVLLKPTHIVTVDNSIGEKLLKTYSAELMLMSGGEPRPDNKAKNGRGRPKKETQEESRQEG